MKINPTKTAEMRILLTEAPMNPKKNREKMAEIFFEKLGFGALRVCQQAILAMSSEVTYFISKSF